MLRLLSAAVVAPLAFAFAACSPPAAPDDDPMAVAEEQLPAASTPRDPDLRWIAEHGFGGTTFAAACVSRKAGEADVTDEPLPVGDGRTIECTTAGAVDVQTMGVSSSRHEPWCARGTASSWSGGGDPRVVVTVTRAPQGAPWTLVATREGEAIALPLVDAFGGAKAWPIWASVVYGTTGLKRGVRGKSCDEIFSR